MSMNALTWDKSTNVPAFGLMTRVPLYRRQSRPWDEDCLDGAEEESDSVYFKCTAVVNSKTFE